MMPLKLFPRVIATTMILAVGSAGQAWATSPDHCEPDFARAEHRMAHTMRQVARLHEDLKLDAQQEALWKQAEQSSRTSMRELHDKMREQHQRNMAAINQPGADLRAMVRQFDAGRDAVLRQRDANRELWLAVYDSLDAVQKEKARLFLKNRLEQQERGGWFRGPPGVR